MVRIVYDPRLPLTEDHLSRMLTKMKANGFASTSVIRTRDRGITMVVPNDMTNEQVALRLNARNYVLCSMCNSIHFKPMANVSDPFRCPCGKTLNTVKK